MLLERALGLPSETNETFVKSRCMGMEESLVVLQGDFPSFERRQRKTEV